MPSDYVRLAMPLALLLAGTSIAGREVPRAHAATVSVTYQTVSLGTSMSNPASPIISGSGRYVVAQICPTAATSSSCPKAVQVAVFDLTKHTSELVSVSSRGAQANQGPGAVSGYYAVSDDGRYVVFSSPADNLVSGDTNHAVDVFVRDRVRRTTTRVDLTNAGHRQLANGAAGSGVAISGDGRTILFVAGGALAGLSVAQAANGQPLLYAYDTRNRVASVVSVDAGGHPLGGLSQLANAFGISYDGRYVGFIAQGSDGNSAVFVRDQRKRQTLPISTNVPSGLAPGSPPTPPTALALAGDGSWASFTLQANTEAEANRVVARNLQSGAFVGAEPSGTVASESGGDTFSSLDKAGHHLLFAQRGLVTSPTPDPSHGAPGIAARLYVVSLPSGTPTEVWPPANCSTPADACYQSSYDGTAPTSISSDGAATVFTTYDNDFNPAFATDVANGSSGTQLIVARWR